jgi:formate hydrogenlyase subunit 6/NADH:ubiquinone oxidoreductase subunit I
MGVRFDESPDDMECISCLSCSRACNFNAITLEVGGVPVTNLHTCQPKNVRPQL